MDQSEAIELVLSVNVLPSCLMAEAKRINVISPTSPDCKLVNSVVLSVLFLLLGAVF